MITPQKIYHRLYTDKEKFVILITGGRGSGKSFNVSAFIERLTFELFRSKGKKIVHTILYARFTMISAGMSVVPEFMDKIEADGTTKFFHKAGSDIVNKMTGSRIMFRGIRTSSGNQTAKLKSIHGITTFICDEAEEWTSEVDFDKIMLSIRQKGIQNRIIIIMNPTDNNHFIYKKYIENTHELIDFDGVPVQISTHPNVLHIHTTYLDNITNLSEQFTKEVAQLKINNPDKYAHTIMGQWSDIAEGAIFKRVGIVSLFPEQCKHIAVGIDFGFTHDPTAIILNGIVDNRLYSKELCYKTNMLARDIIEVLKPYQGVRVYADSADPRLIQEIANAGILIYPVDKGSGSIIAGITKLSELEWFVTKESYNLQLELRNYVWDKDKDGNFINQPIDKYNHGIDAVRYYVLAQLLGKVLKPRQINQQYLSLNSL